MRKRLFRRLSAGNNAADAAARRGSARSLASSDSASRRDGRDPQRRSRGGRDIAPAEHQEIAARAVHREEHPFWKIGTEGAAVTSSPSVPSAPPLNETSVFE